MKRIPSALPAWLVQRLSALYMLLFLLYALGRWNLARPDGYAAWRAWALHASIRLPLALFCIALLLHGWVGLRDVILDYIHPVPLRLGALALVAAYLAALAVAVAQVLTG
ncbi:MAG: succinate dehydrogenase, hydrophobic membrane anchor protein [Betaproteobacteria bacterium]|nr:succinate dehydrogenase, hydrophobic membrane anchor protein [Betaproteobacteria bacterium]